MVNWGKVWVYFAGAYEGTELRFVKIGYTSAKNPNVRIDAVRDGVPHDVRLLVATPGCFALEDLYHQEFRKDRVRGEWFKPSGEVMCRVETLLAAPGSWKPWFGKGKSPKSRRGRRAKVRDPYEMTTKEREERMAQMMQKRPGW